MDTHLSQAWWRGRCKLGTVASRSICMWSRCMALHSRRRLLRHDSTALPQSAIQSLFPVVPTEKKSETEHVSRNETLSFNLNTWNVWEPILTKIIDKFTCVTQTQSLGLISFPVNIASLFLHFIFALAIYIV